MFGFCAAAFSCAPAGGMLANTDTLRAAIQILFIRQAFSLGLWIMALTGQLSLSQAVKTV
jgi:hypothetical protein